MSSCVKYEKGSIFFTNWVLQQWHNISETYQTEKELNLIIIVKQLRFSQSKIIINSKLILTMLLLDLVKRKILKFILKKK